MRNGKAVPVWHAESGEGCPACEKKETKLEPVNEPVKAETPKPEPPPPEKKPPLLRRLGFGVRETSPEIALAPPKNPEPTYFVDAPHVKKVANLVYGGIRWAFNLYDNFACTEQAGMKRFTERYPRLVTLSESQSTAIDIDPRLDLWGRLATGGTRLLGCKTAEQAHNLIDTADLIAGFGGLMLYGGSHIAESWRKGKPFRDAKRAAKKAALAIRKKNKGEVHNEPITQGEGGVVSTVGLGIASGA